MIYNYSKGDAILLDGAAQLINLSYFKSHEFVKVLVIIVNLMQK